MQKFHRCTSLIIGHSDKNNNSQRLLLWKWGKTMNSNERKGEEVPQSPRYSAYEGVMQLENWIRQRAAGMCRCKPQLIDDLVQTMSLGVLDCRKEHTLGFFKRRAALRGID